MLVPVFARRRASPDPRDLTADQRRGVPRHFEAVAEALAAGHSPIAACAVAGTTAAADGASLGETLSALSATYAALGPGEPPFAAVEALSVAWSEETLAFVNDVSCEDPLTGLASGPHLRARLSEVYRDAASTGGTPRTTHALLVVDLRSSRRDGLDPTTRPRDPFEQALALAAAAELVRETFPRGTVARVGGDKVVTLVERGPDLGTAVAGLHAALVRGRVASRPRLWIEGLPDAAEAAAGVVSTLSLS